MLNHYSHQMPPDTEVTKKALHKKCVDMTDIFYSFPVRPAHYIYLVADIGNDGVGDLIHQIRAYHVLNRAFPGHIKCIAFVFKELQSKYEKIAEDHQILIEFRDIRTPTTPENAHINNDVIDLVIHISLMVDKPRILAPHARYYSLLEIQAHSPEVHKRHTVGHMGFLYNAEGIWFDDIAYGNSKSTVLFHASNTLKMMMGASYIRTEQGAQSWLNTTWISDSHYFEKNNFVYALIAQLQFINNKSLNIMNMIIKYVSKDRKGNSWELEKLLLENPVKNVLISLNVNTLVINNSLITLAPSGNIILRLMDTHLSQQDYHTFTQLINGVSLPAGDNTYSESWSNKNTMFPPIPELRNYKQASLAALEEVITSLNISERKKDWLRDLIVFCQRMNLYANEKGTEWLINESLRLGDHWANGESPHETWVTFASALQHHDLNKRLISIVKEQLMFAARPDLIAVKDQLLVSTQAHAIADYRHAVFRISPQLFSTSHLPMQGLLVPNSN